MGENCMSGIVSRKDQQTGCLKTALFSWVIQCNSQLTKLEQIQEKSEKNRELNELKDLIVKTAKSVEDDVISEMGKNSSNIDGQLNKLHSILYSKKMTDQI